MTRHLLSLLSATGLVALLVFSGCGSDSGSGNTTDTAKDAGSTAKDSGAVGGKDAGSSAKDAGAKEDPCDKCTADQNCVAGACVDKPCKDGCKAGEICDTKADGGKGKCLTPKCAMPTKWGPNTAKITKLNIAESDGGCDLNDDAVPDNALGALKDLAGSQLVDAVKKGSIVILLDAVDYKTDGNPFGLNLLIGDLDASNDKCDPTTAGCKYTVTPKNYDQTVDAAACPAVVNFPKTSIKTGKMTAGGKDQVFDLTIPVSGLEIKIKITQAQLKGDTKADDKWTETKNGKVCGVITKENLSQALDAIPEEQLKELGGKAAVQNILDSLLTADIDTDGDDEADAISVALDFETLPGEVVGLSKEATPTK